MTPCFYTIVSNHRFSPTDYRGVVQSYQFSNHFTVIKAASSQLGTMSFGGVSPTCPEIPSPPLIYATTASSTIVASCRGRRHFPQVLQVGR